MHIFLISHAIIALIAIFRRGNFYLSCFLVALNRFRDRCLGCLLLSHEGYEGSKTRSKLTSKHFRAKHLIAYVLMCLVLERQQGFSGGRIHFGLECKG